MNALALIALIVLPIVAFAAYRYGAARERAAHAVDDPPPAAPAAPPPSAQAGTVAPHTDALPPAPASCVDPIRHELARLVRGYEAEAWNARVALQDERRALSHARTEAERYRRIVVDIENNAPPPLFDGPGTPDDLKLIVGIGPVLERMLHQLGVGSYRQIARWTEQDIDAIDAKLPEFPGRIRRDAWVTQARALHLSKYGTPP